MKISFITIGNDVQTNGFRKMASLARSIHPDVEVCYIVIPNPYFNTNLFQKSGEFNFEFSDNDLRKISNHLAKADIICFSSMSMYAKLAKEVINEVRSVNEKVFIVWGGIHPIVHSEDAIRSADAICVGEGETAFKKFLSVFKEGGDFTKTGNFWFNINGEIIRNNFLPLHKQEEMNKFPLPLYAEEELVYKRNTGFVPLDFSKYLSYNSLTYNTIWSIGCPYKCIYCSNSKFIANDKNYRKIRTPSVDYVISEIKTVLTKHPHISVIVFHDDSFMAIPIDILNEFAERWRNEIRLPFCVLGAIPSLVQKDKMQLLVWAGMYRIRMGIQSGSDRTLKFYRRPNRPGLIQHAASIINQFTNYMVPPGYDIIVDNPLETRKDIIDTLELLYSLPRPFMLNIFTLRVIPNTELAHEFSKLDISHPGIDYTDYTSITPNFANVLVYMLAAFRPPKKIYEFLLKYVRESSKEQPKYPLALHILRLIMLIKVLFSRMRFMEFPGLPGKISFLIWKLGIIRFWQTKILKRSSKILF
ncbi:MAG: B12-binding domain-containing radical SAM protein [Candidatus Anammoxibacter sp.]